MVKQSLPILSNAIISAKKDESWVAGSAIDLVSSLVQGAAEDRLGEGFFGLLGPNLFLCLATAEDRDVLQVNLKYFRLKSYSNTAAEWHLVSHAYHPKRLQSTGFMG